MSAKKQQTHNTAYDIHLLFPVLFLVGIGIVMVYSASSAVALKKFGSDYLFLKKQAVFALVGIIGLVICRHFPYRWYRLLTYPLLALALVLLATPALMPALTALMARPATRKRTDPPSVSSE